MKHGFLKAAVSRTVHLRECPFPLYFYYSGELMCPGPLSLCNSLVSFHPSPCVFCFCYSFCLCFYLCVCLSHFSLPLSCSHYFPSTACTLNSLLSLVNPFRFPAPFLLFLRGFVVSINIHPFQLRLLQRRMMHDPCFIAHGGLL